jgi:hypothetical protein
LLDADPPRTWPHLNIASSGIEVGGPQTLSSKGVGRANATAAAATIATAVVVVAVILLLAGLLWLLLLRALLMLLLSWRAFWLTGGGRG